ncbi:MAG: hypothetical protein JNL28_02820 [Planctomycetes bacterium]|nr:hypothetical protein [Planctomycetota bacterium]
MERASTQLLAATAMVLLAFGGGWAAARHWGSERPHPVEEDHHSRVPPVSHSSPTVALMDVTESRRLPAAEMGSSEGAHEEPLTIAREPTMEEALEALNRAILNRPIYEDDDSQFEEKYRGATVEAAAEALKLVSEEYRRQSEALVKDRMASGLYTETFRRDGEPAPRMRGSGKGLSTFGGDQKIMPDGMIRERITEIKADEYPEFNSLRMEQWYLIRKTKGKRLNLPTPVGTGSNPSGG